ncbi:MAG TPA: restriction endonuclease, partial [Candidatus Dormibacteraeota bacterium]
VEAPPPAPPPAVEAPPAKAPKPRKERGPSFTDRISARLAEEARKREQERLAAEERERAEILNSLRRMSWEAYHALIQDLFRRDGYITLLLPEDPPSVGDFWAERSDDRALVQYRLRDAEVVPAGNVVELAASAHQLGAYSSWLFTSGIFASDAEAVAQQYNVTLVNGQMLADLVIQITVREWKQQQGAAKLVRRLRGVLGGDSEAA